MGCFLFKTLIYLLKGGCSEVDNASELHVGGMSSILTPGNNFHYFLTTPHGEEFAQLKPCIGDPSKRK